MILSLSLAGGGRAFWRAVDDAVLPILQCLKDCTGLPEADGLPGELGPEDTLLDLHAVDMAVKDRTFTVRYIRGRSDLAPDSQHYGVWLEPEKGEFGEKVLFGRCRQLFFLGLAGSQLRGAVTMVHGGMARSPQGETAIFCGPSGIGKSTLMGKLDRGGWEVLADDCFLLSTDPQGVVWGTPATTWSVFTDGKPQLYKADPQCQLPVKKLFLLERDAHDSMLPISSDMAALGLTPSFSDMVIWHTWTYPEDIRRKLLLKGFETARLLVKGLEVKRLLLSLEGTPAVMH